MAEEPRIAPALDDAARERMLNAQPSVVYHARPEDLLNVRIEGPEDAIIDDVMVEYRGELLDAMRRYHGCDGRAGNACRADVFRVDKVILPVVRKMLEDVFWKERGT